MNIIKEHIKDYNDSFYSGVFQTLPQGRQVKVQRCRKKFDQYSCILGDYLLRKIVSETIACAVEDVIISHTETGQPYIVYPSNTGAHISLSHSGGFVVAAINSTPIGIDIEMIRDIDDVVLDHVLSDAEKEYVWQSRQRFFEVWTMKEAYLKCIGTGLSGCKSLKDIVVFDLPQEYNDVVISFTDKYVISVCCKLNDM